MRCSSRPLAGLERAALVRRSLFLCAAEACRFQLPRASILNPYKILGIAEDATLDEIKAAYRERARRYHPDAGGDAWAFQQVQQAYDMLLEKHGSPDAGEGGASAATPAEVRQSPPDQAGGTTRSMRPHEIAIIAGVIALLVALMYWQWVWRLLAVTAAIGLGAFATWLFVFIAYPDKDKRLPSSVGGAICTVFSLLLFWWGVSTGRPSFIGTKDIARTAPAILVTWKEKDVQEVPLIGSALVYASDGTTLKLYTNAHVLGLENLAQLAARQRDGTANLTKFKVEVHFPSGQTRTANRIALGRASVDVACIEVRSEGLVAGKDYLPVPVIADTLRTLGLQTGDDVIAVGTPIHLEFAGSPTYGKVSSLRVFKDDPAKTTWIQHDATITGGNSGGPLFLKRGSRAYWIGMNTLSAEGTSMSWAITTDDIVKTDFQWADATPTGAASLINNVYGVAAVAGDQQAKFATTAPVKPGTSFKPSNASRDEFAERLQEISRPSIWPLTDKFPFVKFPQIIPWFLAYLGISRVIRSWQRDKRPRTKK